MFTWYQCAFALFQGTCALAGSNILCCVHNGHINYILSALSMSKLFSKAPIFLIINVPIESFACDCVQFRKKSEIHIEGKYHNMTAVNKNPKIVAISHGILKTFVDYTLDNATWNSINTFFKKDPHYSIKVLCFATVETTRPRFNKDRLFRHSISIIKIINIRRSGDLLIFIMGISILVGRHFLYWDLSESDI